jgi:hypothetical protein
MRAEQVVYTLLLADAGVIAAVAGRVYPSRIPQNSQMPALAYQVVSGNEITPIDAQAGYQVVQTRVQITAMAKNYNECKGALEAARKALLYKSGTIAGIKVLSILRGGIGPDLREDDTSLYVQSTDYLVTHYES